MAMQIVTNVLLAYCSTILMGASIVKWTKQVLRYTKAMVFLVKRL